MALLWIEGFEGFGTTPGAAPSPTGVLARKYSDVSAEASIHVEAGRWSGYCLEFNASTNYIHSPTGLTTNATMVVGLAVYFTALMAHEFLTFYEGSNRGVNLRLTEGGELAVYLADVLIAPDGGEKNPSSGAGIQINTWYYIEMKVTTNNTSGSVYVRLNTTPVISLTNEDTQPGSNARHDAFRISNAGGQYMKFDDLYCLDASGSAPQNDFLGVKQVITLFPSAAGGTTQWTPSAGSNYDCVNETACDDDGTYVQTAAAGALDLYTYDDIPGATMTSNIVGIQINTDVKRTQATSYTLYQAAKRITQSDGSGVTISNDAYQTKTRIMPLDTEGVAWTETNINATEFGLILG